MKALLALGLLAAGAPAMARGGPDDWGEVWTAEQLEREAPALRRSVEALRGKTFRSEVPVRLTDRESLRATLRERLRSEASTASASALATVAKMLGMLPPDADPVALAEALSFEPTGYYDAADDVLYLIDGLASERARVALVRELAHALDEQHFGLTERDARSGSSVDARLAHRAVVLGSGLALAERWLHERAQELGALETLGFGAALDPSSARGLPPFVWKPEVALLARGEPFLRRTNVVRPVAGTARSRDVERALTVPPRSTEQVLHPVKYWKEDRADEPRPVACDASHLPEGWTLVHEDTLGELYLGVLTLPLSERGGFQASTPGALATLDCTTPAAEGWGGDRVVLLEHGEGRAVHLVTVWDSPRDAREFLEAMLELRPAILGDLGAVGAGGHGLEIGRGLSGEVWVTSWVGVEPTAVERVVAALGCCGEHRAAPGSRDGAAPH